jgi:hypothetical protein
MATIGRALAELAATAGAAATDPHTPRWTLQPGIACWRRSTCTAPTTFATASRPS